MHSQNNHLRHRFHALASNLWWSWQPEATSLFRDLDPSGWRATNHNAIGLLQDFEDARLIEIASDRAIDARVDEMYRTMQRYLDSTRTWGDMHAGALRQRPVAYFSAEFGIHESLPVYSGGLGVLAGDHLKSASDLGIPLVGVGLFYARGYFTQLLDANGWQQEQYPETDRNRLPIERAVSADGNPVQIEVETLHGAIRAAVWRLRVGRVPLFLLDSDVDGNAPEDRELTARLYGGDSKMRIRQELLLGVGGMRALLALRVRPSVIHINEGHSAFAPLELVRQTMEWEGIRFDDALRKITRSVVFTTHTPVPAGHDRFDSGAIEEHLGPLRKAFGLEPESFMALGRVVPSDHHELFCMTVLALKLARCSNGVSALHGHVSRQMWQCLWPNRAEHEVPIGHITNGVHVLSWLAPPMRRLYDRHFPTDWTSRTSEAEVWSGIEAVSAPEIWETHQALKSHLINLVRRRARAEAERRGESKEVIDKMARALQPEVLLIGFARRFATYKRATLVLDDLLQLESMVNHSERPVQIVFAGKAHPQDDEGKRLLQKIHHVSRSEAFLGKVVFLENYDINLGRHLVQGVDVWLNNPRRPQEASGTSGQKVVLNGGLNCSILDGWWAEAFDGWNGFAIGSGQTHSDMAVMDRQDASDLVHTLSKEVVPCYYDRSSDGLPHAWIDRMKRAIRTLGWRFNADRMVRDYVTSCYLPAAGVLSCEMNFR